MVVTWPETIASWMEEVTTSNLNETILKTKQPLTIRFRGGILLLKIHDIVPGQLLASFVIPQSLNIFIGPRSDHSLLMSLTNSLTN